MISPILTDLYQLTMAYGYWKLNMHEQTAVFQQIFRKQPFKGEYTVCAGLATVIEFLKNWHFAEDDIIYLQSLMASNNTPLFEPAFLNYLQKLRFSADIDAIPEGNIIFPHAPILRITGPLIQGQLLESILLNIINFQTLIATKSARVCQAAKGDTVLEFGMRRAQGPDGALSASRAAYIGGCSATSNVSAGKNYGIPVVGTHAHSWVSAFPDELTAFNAYAHVMPNNCVLLVDTYDTIQGVKNAIKIGKQLQTKGAELKAIRLDSGDLAALSIKARALLDEAGLTQTEIIASNSLDEYVITKLKQQGAKISIWGVGTHLTTAYDHPALDGVYKLCALKNSENKWDYKLKLSEQAVKISNPGIHQVRRFFYGDKLLADVIYDTDLGINELPNLISLEAPYKSIKLESYADFRDLLQPVFRQGKQVYPNETINVIRERALKEVSLFMQTKSLASYPVVLENKLHEMKQELILKTKKVIL